MLGDLRKMAKKTKDYLSKAPELWINQQTPDIRLYCVSLGERSYVD